MNMELYDRLTTNTESATGRASSHGGIALAPDISPELSDHEDVSSKQLSKPTYAFEKTAERIVPEAGSHPDLNFCAKSSNANINNFNSEGEDFDDQSSGAVDSNSIVDDTEDSLLLDGSSFAPVHTAKLVRPYGIDLPNIRNQADSDGVLARRLQTYQSFTAPDSFMQNLGPIDESLFTGLPGLHLNYYVKTVSTIKCDLCEAKCRINSEVYQCRDCTSQVCRECVEDKLAKEQANPAGTSWEWQTPAHRPFKAAYLLRKHKTVAKFGQGDWIGSVRVHGTSEIVQVKLELTPNSNAKSKNTTDENNGDSIQPKPAVTRVRKKYEKRKLNQISLANASDEADQRRQVQAGTMNSERNRKMDRIREAAAAAAHASESNIPPTLRPRSLPHCTDEEDASNIVTATPRKVKKPRGTLDNPEVITSSPLHVETPKPALFDQVTLSRSSGGLHRQTSTSHNNYAPPQMQPPRQYQPQYVQQYQPQQQPHYQQQSYRQHSAQNHPAPYRQPPPGLPPPSLSNYPMHQVRAQSYSQAGPSNQPRRNDHPHGWSVVPPPISMQSIPMGGGGPGPTGGYWDGISQLHGVYWEGGRIGGPPGLSQQPRNLVPIGMIVMDARTGERFHIAVRATSDRPAQAHQVGRLSFFHESESSVESSVRGTPDVDDEDDDEDIHMSGSSDSGRQA